MRAARPKAVGIVQSSRGWRVGRGMGPRIAVTVGCVTGLLAFGAGPAGAASLITVTNDSDAGAGSLREAVHDVDTGGTIVIPSGIGEITLTGELVVDKSLMIEGAGSAQTAIDAGTGADSTRVLHVVGSPQVVVSGVQFTGGRVVKPGGVPETGGGIEVDGGSLALVDSLVTNNVVDTSGGMAGDGISEGGGIAALGASSSLALVNTTVSDDRALGGKDGDAFGGGIYAEGSLVIEGGLVQGNTAVGAALDGGGIEYNGSAAAILENLSVTGNVAEPAAGGTANGDGGGIDLHSGTGDTLTNVTVADNLMTVDDPTAMTGVAEGGGISFRSPGATLVNATVTGNTVSANVMSGGEALGGGVSAGAAATVLSSTIASNTSTASGTGLVSEGGNLWTGAEVDFKNSIVANGAVANGEQNCFPAPPGGSIVSDGHNIEDLDMCGFDGPGDQVNISPALQPLAENGGPVQTLALQPGSPAIDAGDNDGCPATDARGVARPVGPACDVGAFEVATPTATTDSASGVGITAATLNGTATNPDLAGGTVSFQFGKTTAYGSQTAPQPIAAITSDARFSAAVGGLAPGTTYHFRQLVTNAAATSGGTDQTFTTSPTPAGVQPPAPPTPGGPPAPPPPTPPNTENLNASGSGSGLTFVLKCSKPAVCHVKVVATTTEQRRGRKIVAVLSSTPKLRRHTVMIAAAKVTVPAGETRRFTLKLNRLGRSLQARFTRLPVAVTITLTEPGGKTARVVRVFHRTLKPPKKHKHH